MTEAAGMREALAALKAGDAATAIRLLDDWLAAKPDDAAAWGLFAVAQTERGQADLAREAFERAAALAPDDASLRYNYARALERFSEPELARAEYEECLRLAPDHPRVRERLEALGQSPEAPASAEESEPEEAADEDAPSAPESPAAPPSIAPIPMADPFRSEQAAPAEPAKLRISTGDGPASGPRLLLFSLEVWMQLWWVWPVLMLVPYALDLYVLRLFLSEQLPWLAWLLRVPLYAVFIGAMVAAATEAIAGRDPEPHHAFVRLGNNAFGIVPTWLLYSLAAGLPALAWGAFGGRWLMDPPLEQFGWDRIGLVGTGLLGWQVLVHVVFGPAVAASAVEGRHAFSGVAHSWRVGAGSRLRYLATYAVASFVAAPVVFFMSMVSDSVGLVPFIGWAIALLVEVWIVGILTALVWVATAVCYQDAVENAEGAGVATEET